MTRVLTILGILVLAPVVFWMAVGWLAILRVSWIDLAAVAAVGIALVMISRHR